MERSCSFYSQIPGFKLVYGGLSDDTFTTFEIGEGDVPKMYLNLELNITNNNCEPHHATYADDRKQRQYFGQIIFHTQRFSESNRSNYSHGKTIRLY